MRIDSTDVPEKIVKSKTIKIRITGGEEYFEFYPQDCDVTSFTDQELICSTWAVDTDISDIFDVVAGMFPFAQVTVVPVTKKMYSFVTVELDY